MSEVNTKLVPYTQYKYCQCCHVFLHIENVGEKQGKLFLGNCQLRVLLHYSALMQFPISYNMPQFSCCAN